MRERRALPILLWGGLVDFMRVYEQISEQILFAFMVAVLHRAHEQ